MDWVDATLVQIFRDNFAKKKLEWFWLEAINQRVESLLAEVTYLQCLGSGCSTAVECTPCNREVVGSVSACWAFFYVYRQYSVHKRVPCGGGALMFFL